MIAQRFRIDSFGISDPGKVRDLNEDRFIARPDMGLWAVADGMGGHDAGEIASRIITDEVASIGISSSGPDLEERFVDRITRANQEIRAMGTARGSTMGATLAALLVFEDQFVAIWSGDSRIYRLTPRGLVQVTRDHTEVQDLLDKGVITEEQAATWPRKNVITRAIGVYDMPRLDRHYGRIAAGEMFLMCSDGLTAHVTDPEIGAALRRGSSETICQGLLATTLDRGASDNVTILAIGFDRPGGAG